MERASSGNKQPCRHVWVEELLVSQPLETASMFQPWKLPSEAVPQDRSRWPSHELWSVTVLQLRFKVSSSPRVPTKVRGLSSLLSQWQRRADTASFGHLPKTKGRAAGKAIRGPLFSFLIQPSLNWISVLYNIEAR